jgi:hypothetical protein
MFNIESNGDSRDTADYIMADRNNPLHSLYAGLLNRYNGYNTEATNAKVTGAARADAQTKADRVQAFITMLAPVQRKFHDRFSANPNMESIFWNGYYRSYGDRADPKHMERMATNYLESTQGATNPDEWFRNWEIVSGAMTAESVRSVPRIDENGRPKRKPDGTIETDTMKVPETSTDRMVRDRYMAALGERFRNADRDGVSLNFDVTDPDHAAAAKKGYSDYMRLKKSGVDLFGTVD